MCTHWGMSCSWDMCFCKVRAWLIILIVNKIATESSLFEVSAWTKLSKQCNPAWIRFLFRNFFSCYQLKHFVCHRALIRCSFLSKNSILNMSQWQLYVIIMWCNNGVIVLMLHFGNFAGSRSVAIIPSHSNENTSKFVVVINNRLLVFFPDMIFHGKSLKHIRVLEILGKVLWVLEFQCVPR